MGDGAPEPEQGGAPLFILSPRQHDELVQLARGGGWRVVAERRADDVADRFADSGAAVAVVDARGALADGLAAVRALDAPARARGAAVLALVSRGDVGAAGALYAAGATHFLASPAGEGEFVHALRFAARFAERLGSPPPHARRRDDPPPAVARGAEAVRRWAAGRLAAGRPVGVVRAALARFDLVNAAHGRDAGDWMLDEAGARVGRVVAELFGPDATVARVAGAEFALAADATPDATAGAAARVADALGAPFGPAVAGARVGYAAGGPGEDAGALLRRAADALLAAAVDGAPLRPAAAAGPASADDLAVDLHHALARGEVAVLFQPQVEVATGRIVGAEALARWRHPRLGPLGADPLFAAAERAGLGLALSDHVQSLALAGAAAWGPALAGLRLSVNVTAADLEQPDFAARLVAKAAVSGFPAERLTVEVTETRLIADLPAARALLAALRGAGCRTAIDDFGTGHSSLAWLDALPLDYLKLDRALAADAQARGAGGRVVARAALAMARSLGLLTIAEGVETEAQRARLAGEGCDLYQGFLCAGALDAAALARLVEANRA